jgi:hypothetical protein
MGGRNVRNSDSLGCRGIRDTGELLPLLNPFGFMRSDTHGIGGVVLKGKGVGGTACLVL